MPAVLARARSGLRALRARAPVLDHAVRTYQHADAVLWGRLAGSVTYFGFLALFPLIAVGFAVLSYLTVVSAGIRDGVEDAVAGAFPGLLGEGPNQIDIDDIAGVGAGAGVVGLATLLWTGTGAVDAIRDAVRTVFGTAHVKIPLPRRKARDLGVLVVLGLLVLSSVAVSAVTTAVTSQLLGLVGLGDAVVARLLLRALTLLLALTLNALVLATLLRTLSGRHPGWRELRGGVLLGAVGLEALKLLATRLLAGTESNPLYAGFAVVVGLLLWIHFSARVLVLSAAWVATEPALLAAQPDVRAVHPAALPLVVSPDVPPPGSAGPAARAARAARAALAVAVVAAVLARRRRSRS